VRGIDVLQHFQEFQLLSKCSAQSRTGLRNRALIALFYGSGIRLREALSVRPKDLDLKAGTVAIQRGKGGRRRVSAIVPDALPLLARWADVRATLALKGAAPVCSVPNHRACCTRRFRIHRRRYLHLDFDVGSRHANPVSHHGSLGRRARDLSRADVESCAMVRAGHLVTRNRAFGQWPSSMSTRVVERKELAVDVEQSDLLALHLDQTRLTGFGLSGRLILAQVRAEAQGDGPQAGAEE